MSNILRIHDNLRYSTAQNSDFEHLSLTSECEKFPHFSPPHILILRSTKNLSLFNKTLLLEKIRLRGAKWFSVESFVQEKKVGTFSGMG